MKKRRLFVTFICMMLLLSSCAAPSVKSDTTVSPQENAATASAPAVPPDASETAEATAEPKDSGLTLAGIKQAAEAAGYKTEDSQDYQMIDEPKPVDSFNLIYEDDYTSTYTPVLEFKDAGDAAKYAKMVNDEGYNLCIINGKFLTMTSAQYGITVNDKQTAVLETLLQGKVMDYTEPAYVPLKPAQDFAGAYLHVDAIYKAVDKLINRSVLLNDKAVPEEERVSAAFVTFSLLSSGDLSFVSVLSEDQLQLDAIVQVWEMFGATDVKL